jgi:Holliday junction resolvasome RuvABC endonuclease subunit
MPNPKTKLLAIDPGTREMGFACFEDKELVDYGVKAIKRGRATRDLFIHLEEILTRLITEKRPKTLVLEKNNFSQIKQNVLLTLAVHKIKAVANRHRVPVVEYNPRTVRKVVCNNGNATKRELARTVAAGIPELKPFLESNRRWRERYYQNIFDAVACGLARLKLSTGNGEKLD